MLRIPSRRCQAKDSRCRCKMRMSGLSKVEMSAFIGGRGRHGNGANRLEPIKTRPRSVLPESQFLASCDLLRKAVCVGHSVIHRAKSYRN